MSRGHRGAGGTEDAPRRQEGPNLVVGSPGGAVRSNSSPPYKDPVEQGRSKP